MKTSAVIGASPVLGRYSNQATQWLQDHGHKVYALGRRPGNIGNVEIQTEWPESIENLDTVTLYVGPANQAELYQYILSLKPKRLIFNPGTENAELFNLATKAGIDSEEACTLVMLRVGNY